MGFDNVTFGEASNAFGYSNKAKGRNSSAIGYQSEALADNSTAIGYQAVADRTGAVSVGREGAESQIIHVAAATKPTDAVNFSQLSAVTTALGGGASFNGGTFTNPTYIIQNVVHKDAGSALKAVDTKLTDLDGRLKTMETVETVPGLGIRGPKGDSAYQIAVNNGYIGTEAEWLSSLKVPKGDMGLKGDTGLTGAVGPQGPKGDQGAANTPEGISTITLANANAYTDLSSTKVLTNAKAYTDVNNEKVLNSAKAYTDWKVNELNESFMQYRNDIENRLHKQNERINQVGAISGALTGMSMNASSLSGSNRVAVGVGSQNGEQAVAVGYQITPTPNSSVSIGAAFAKDTSTISAGFGLSW